jgi:hypothetical protein
MKVLTLLLSSALLAGTAHASAQPAEVRQAVAEARLVGSGRLTFWGFAVYDARLWAAPGFRLDQYADHAFALELEYLRDFSNASITERSLREMRRLGNVSEAQARQWQAALQSAFPDVRRGDRIAGVNLPGGRVQFITNGRLTGEIVDADFARLFFGIWLSPATAEPTLRLALSGRDGR